MTTQRLVLLACLMLTLVMIAEMLVPDKAFAARGGASDLSVAKGGEEAAGVLHVERPSWTKIAFGVGMFIAGILSLKYL